MSAILRHPLALLGALTIVSQFRELLTLHDDLAALLDALQQTTRPVWTALLGWLHINAPDAIKDYMTVGVIFMGMLTREHAFKWSVMRARPASTFDYKVIQWFGPSPTIELDAGTPLRVWLVAYPLFAVQDFLFWPYYLVRRSYQFFEQFSVKERDYFWHESFKADVVYLETFFLIIVILLINYAVLYAT